METGRGGNVNDREALEDVLGKLPAISGAATDRHSIPADRLLILATAARERLAQLPGPCEHGQGTSHGPFMTRNADGTVRRNCDGKSYPPALVERIARTIADWYDDPGGFENDVTLAVAVLDALNDTETP